MSWGEQPVTVRVIVKITWRPCFVWESWPHWSKILQWLFQTFPQQKLTFPTELTFARYWSCSPYSPLPFLVVMIENLQFHSFLFNAHHYSDPALNFVAIYNPWAKSKLLSLLLRSLTSQCHLAYSTCFLIELQHISPTTIKNSFVLSVHDLLSFGQHCLQVGNCSLSLSSPLNPDLSFHQESVHPSFRCQSQIHKPKSLLIRQNCSPVLNSHSNTVEFEVICQLCFYIQL